MVNVLPPTPSCTTRNVKLPTPAGAVNVNAALPAPKVNTAFWYDDQSIVWAPVPVMAAS